MLAYPQLSQFPIRKQRRLRTVVNRTAGDGMVKLADPAAEVIEWNLSYQDLTDQDSAALQSFFLSAEGTLNEFTFLDPAANLLAWSESLDKSAWTRGPQLTLSGAQLTNSGGAPQSSTQTLQAPVGYLYCLSAIVRAANPCEVTLLIGSERSTRSVSTGWSRVVFAAAGDPVFGVEIPAGASLELNGIQVEAQGGASAYRKSTSGGVYSSARFRDDILAITATGVNRHTTTVNIIHANHL